MGIIFLTTLVVVSTSSLYVYFYQQTGDTENIDEIVAEDMDHTEFMEDCIFRINPIN